jgi:hypothetical protein
MKWRKKTKKLKPSQKQKQINNKSRSLDILEIVNIYNLFDFGSTRYHRSSLIRFLMAFNRRTIHQRPYMIHIHQLLWKWRQRKRRGRKGVHPCRGGKFFRKAILGKRQAEIVHRYIQVRGGMDNRTIRIKKGVWAVNDPLIIEWFFFLLLGGASIRFPHTKYTDTHNLYEAISISYRRKE